MEWNSIDWLSSLIRVANWGIAIAVLLTFLFTVIVIVADKKRETLTKQTDLAKELEIANINQLAEGANERAQNLEHENLTLRGEVAHLDTLAADAKAAQQRVQIELDKQRERTAKAEEDLLKVRKRQEPRNLFAIDVENLKQFLADKPRSPVIISCVNGNPEGCTFAEQIKNVLVSCGWNVSGVFPKLLTGSPSGIILHIPSSNKNIPTIPDQLPAAAPVLIEAFRKVLSIDLDRRFPIVMSLPSDTVEILVGYQ